MLFCWSILLLFMRKHKIKSVISFVGILGQFARQMCAKKLFVAIKTNENNIIQTWLEKFRHTTKTYLAIDTGFKEGLVHWYHIRMPKQCYWQLCCNWLLKKYKQLANDKTMRNSLVSKRKIEIQTQNEKVTRNLHEGAPIPDIPEEILYSVLMPTKMPLLFVIEAQCCTLFSVIYVEERPWWP